MSALAEDESVAQLLRRRDVGKQRSQTMKGPLAPSVSPQLMKPVGTRQVFLATFFYAVQHNWQRYWPVGIFVMKGQLHHVNVTSITKS